MSDLRVLEPVRDANRHRRGKLSPALLIGLVVAVVLALAGAAFGVLKARGSAPTRVAAAANTQPPANQPPAADPDPAQAADVPAAPAPATTAPGATKPTKAPATNAPANRPSPAFRRPRPDSR